MIVSGQPVSDPAADPAALQTAPCAGCDEELPVAEAARSARPPVDEAMHPRTAMQVGGRESLRAIEPT